MCREKRRYKQKPLVTADILAAHWVESVTRWVLSSNSNHVPAVTLLMGVPAHNAPLLLRRQATSTVSFLSFQTVDPSPCFQQQNFHPNLSCRWSNGRFLKTFGNKSRPNKCGFIVAVGTDRMLMIDRPCLFFIYIEEFVFCNPKTELTFKNVGFRKLATPISESSARCLETSE